MKGILYAAAEGLPYIKSGGLADVIGSLPQCIDHKKYRMAVVLPMYKKIMEKYEMEKICDFNVQSGIINKQASLYKDVSNGVEYYFIRQDD
ncbi:MAG: glycogen/starch synthase, partial [Erysipelotrichaceae bacterium]|nr:glycogen/starch synthase [Erysipelotrichaceae bacterium]